ncbi:MAG: class I SAM-dependent methyltransferase [Planctomycetota bacterium]
MPQATSESADTERIERERDFHNKRFADENRLDQVKYYEAIRRCEERYESRVRESAAGGDVLEYGCAKGERSLQLASTAKSVRGIDISDVAIDQGNAAADDAGYDHVRFAVMNAEDMTFEDESFDLVFGSGIIHHLDVKKSVSEVSRVLRPGGIAIFREPLGHNVLINKYRDRTPDARTPDEHPLLKPDFDFADRVFTSTSIRYYGLTTIGAVFLRNSPFGGIAMSAARAVDSAIFAVPPLRWQAWYVLVEWTK